MSPPVIFSSSEASTIAGVDQFEVEQLSCEASSARTPEILGLGLVRQSAKPAARLTNKVRQANFAGVPQESMNLRITSLSGSLSRSAPENHESSSPSVRCTAAKKSRRAT